MTAIQTLKNARVLAAKEVEHARKAHTKFKAQAEKFNNAFTAVKTTLMQAEAGLKALDDTLRAMGETKAPAPVKIAAKVQTKKAARAARVVKAAPAKPAKVAKHAKPAKIEAKTKAPKAAKKAARKGVSRQAAGRREVAEGKRPTFRDAIVKVMGSKVLSKIQVHDLLKAKGWLPNSNDTIGYVGYMLSGTKTKDAKGVETHLFERVAAKGRGFYRVKQEAAAASALLIQVAPKAKRKYTKKAAAAPKAEAKAEPEQPKAEVNGVTTKSANDILQDAGMDTTEAPFG